MTGFEFTHQKRAIAWACAATLALGLAACGGGGTTGQTLTGKVMDGYIKGAIVCFDADSNGACDAGEPKTETTAGGAFSLAIDEGASLGGANLLVDVPVGAIDEDSPNTEIATSYTMRGIAATNAVVSPLTTLIASHMDSNMSLTEASAAALVSLGMTGIDLQADYVASENIGVHNVAKVLAAAYQLNPTAKGASLAAIVAGMQTQLSTAKDSNDPLSASEVAGLAEAAKPNDPTQSGLVTNGDFETGDASGWSGNAANAVTENGNTYNFANVEKVGNAWDVNLSYVLDIPKEGVRYKLSFDAWSDKADRKLIAGIGLNADPWTNVTENVLLTTTSKTYEFYFTSNFAGANSRILFDMGHDTGVVGIDNVKLEEVSPNLITNGDFEAGDASGWSGNAANAVTENGNTYNFANVEKAGNAYDVNLSYVLDIPESGVRYKLKFDAWSDKADRKLIAGIGLNQDPWTNVTESVLLTTSAKTYEYYFTSNFAGSNSRVLFDMGHDTGVVGIDNVSLELAPADNSGASTASAPSEAAPTPSQAAQDVVSIFSDSYTSLAVSEWGPNWGESSARITDATAGNDAVKSLQIGAGQAFAAIDFSGAKFDASSLTTMHLDYWIASPLNAGQVLAIKLSNHDGSAETSAIEKTIVPSTGGQWVSVDIPLSDFVSVHSSGSLSRNALAQIAITAARADMSQPVVVYIDNLYFYR